VSLDNLQPSKLTVTVSDTGSGIPLKRRARVFERFYRGAEYSGNYKDWRQERITKKTNNDRVGDKIRGDTRF
jgi:DNA topoisomerase VI subunit B